MAGIIDVTSSTYGALGDGCHDDTAAINAALQALKRSDAVPGPCAPDPQQEVPGAESWDEYASGLYFPAGLYRITAPLNIPYAQNVRIFGDGGRGGGYVGKNLVPTGTLIRQDTDDAPIFVFDQSSSNVTIERLGFTWQNQQEVPQGWSYRAPDTGAPPSYAEPGAVAILFSGGGRPSGDVDDDFQHVRISDCSFVGGWRGVAIDERYGDGTVALFDTQISHCLFSRFRGAAISLVNHPAKVIGMTSNSVRDVFIDNRDNLNANPPEPSQNDEEQIRLLSQACCSLENVDAEWSKMRVLYAAGCVLVITNLYLEHLQIRGQFPNMIFLGSGQYEIRGMNVDGLIEAISYVNNGQPTPSYSTLINAERAQVVVSGVRALPLDPLDSLNNPRTVDLTRDAGFVPLNGETYLVGGNTSTYTLLDRPLLPVFAAGERGTLMDQGAQKSYKEAYTYSDRWQPMTAVVRAPTTKARVDYNASQLVAGAGTTVRVTVTGARPGDVVRIGAPGPNGGGSGLPAGILTSGHVPIADKVDLVLFNASGQPRAAMTGTNSWVIETGGGPLGGAPQLLPARPTIGLTDATDNDTTGPHS